MTDEHRGDDPIIVMTTLSSREHATTLVRSLLHQRLVACGTFFDNTTSIYRWNGDVKEDSETVVMLKTTSARWHDLRSAIDNEHPYDVPEILALPVTQSAEPYLNWIRSETSQGSAQ